MTARLSRRLWLLALLVLLPLAAAAHTALTGAQPADGAVLDRAPAEITLSFTEPVAPTALRLVGESGAARTLDRWRVEGNRLVVPLPGDLGPGAHALSWRVTSADGHPVSGTVGFAIGAAGGRVTVATNTPVVDALIWASRLALCLGLVFGVGALPFHVFVAPAPAAARRLSVAAMGLGLAAIPAALGLQGLDLLGAPLAALADPAPWRAALASTQARTLLVGGLAMAAGLAAWRLGSRRLALLAWAGVGAAVAASGHAAGAAPHWLMRGAVFLHAATVAAWIGALPAFLTAIRGPQGAPMLRRFSRLILPVVLVLVASGAVLAWVQVGRPEALPATAYGRVLLAKLALLAPLFGAAAVNRWRLTPPALAGKGVRAARRLAASARLEILLSCLVLGLVGLWQFTPPPRALAAAEAAAAPAGAHLEGARAGAHLLLDPGRPGRVVASAYLMDPALEPLPAQGVTLSLSDPAAGIAPIRVALQPQEDGGWSAPVLIPVAGTWQLRLDILVSDFDSVRLEGAIAVAP